MVLRRTDRSIAINFPACRVSSVPSYERIGALRNVAILFPPLSLGPDGKIYTENDGILFAVGQQ
jgi:hypothetical protein